MKYRFLTAIMIYIAFSLFGDDAPLTSLKDDRVRALKYGIDDEVVVIINAVRGEKDNSYNDVLLDILATTGNSKIKVPILGFFEEQKTDIASSYAVSLLKLASEDEDVDTNVLLSAISYSGVLKINDASQYLSKLSENNNKVIAAAAIGNLGKIGNSDFAEKFLERLQDDDYEEDESSLRESTILLMGELKYQPAVLTLIDIVQDSDYSSVSRRFACDSLGKIGDEEAIPVLKDLLNDSDSILRSYAISSLAYFKGNEIENILIQALRDSFWRIRVAAAKALADRKSSDAVDILIYKAERDPEDNVKKAAMDALAVIGVNKALSFLADYYGGDRNSDALRASAITALLRENPSKGAERIRDVFEAEWEKNDSWILNYTCRELSTTEVSGFQWFYEKMLDHKNYIIRIYAVRGIRLNNIMTLYGRVREIAEDENENKALRKEAASL